MLGPSEAVDALEAWHAVTPSSWSTGFAMVDDVTGGFAPGQVWIITAAPGQGRSTLATQWALMLATEHAIRTDLVSLRDPVHRLAVRLLACASKVPVPHLWKNELTTDDESKLQRARGLVFDAPLRIAGPGEVSMVWTDPDDPDWPGAFVCDDADLGAGVFPERIAGFAARGVLVILTFPRKEMLGPDGIDPKWARVADFILQIDRPDVLDSQSQRPGEADIALLRNRWGPQLVTTVAFQGHYARFIDMVN